MRSTLLILSFFWASLPTITNAQATWSKIGIYADNGGVLCGVRDDAGFKTVYVIQRFNLGSISTSFRLESSMGMTATITSVTSPYANAVGFPATGTTIAYGGCVLGDHVLLTIELQFFGDSPRCSWIRIAGHPDSVDGNPEAYDCAGTRRVADWLGIHVDDDWGCECPSYFTDEHFCPNCKPYTAPVAVAPTTWGAVKALYH